MIVMKEVEQVDESLSDLVQGIKDIANGATAYDIGSKLGKAFQYFSYTRPEIEELLKGLMQAVGG